MRRVGPFPLPVVIAVGVTLIVMLGLLVGIQVRNRNARLNETTLVIPERFPWVTADSFVLEDESRNGTEPSWELYRPVKEQWSAADVAEFWYDPHEIGVDVLASRVESAVDALLNDVP